jgi:hypothetical protein
LSAKCFYHPRVEAEKNCEGCRLSICDNCEQDGLCRECRNKRKAIADRRARLEGALPDSENAGPGLQEVTETPKSQYDPERVAYRSSSKVYKSMKEPSKGAALVAALTDTRVALTLGLLIGVGVLIFFGSDFLPASEPDYPTQVVATPDAEPEMSTDAVQQPEPVVAASQAAPGSVASPPAANSVDPVAAHMADLWAAARQDAEKQARVSRAVEAQENLRVLREQAALRAWQRQQVAMAEAEESRKYAAEYARAAAQARAAARARPAAPQPVAASPPPAVAGAAAAAPVLGNGGSAGPARVSSAPVLKLLSLSQDSQPVRTSLAKSASGLRYSSSRKRVNKRRRGMLRAEDPLIDGRLKAPLVTQW